MLEIRVNVSEQILKDRARWLKLRSLLVGEEGEAIAAQAKKTARRSSGAGAERVPPPSSAGEPEGGKPRLVSNLQKAAYALQQLHESSPNPAGYTARQMALFLRDQNIDALRAEQLSWALAAMVSKRNSPDKLFARRVRRGRYLPTEHTRELFA
ncbi:MAG: hypothetical protein QME79_00030 [Bacillota bacterium]|nr:hypothetical protein [Bacillota bacterium]